MVNGTHWTDGVHHDPSALYLSNPLPDLKPSSEEDEPLTVRLRIPRDAPVQSVWLRLEPDGEPFRVPMTITETRGNAHIWTAGFKATAPTNTYRFKILSDEGAYHVSAMGVTRAELPNRFDFKLLAGYHAPSWLRHSVFYQIFPDSFYKGDLSKKPPQAIKIDSVPTYQAYSGYYALRFQQDVVHFHGGDLVGVIAKLDYLQQLGINALYLNPIFKSSTPHRFDIEDFYQVDEYLGGNQAVIDLRHALNRKGMRLILDITLNHVSAQNGWFQKAWQNRESPEARFFTFTGGEPGYVHWFGDKYLPKLNYNDAETRDQMYRFSDSVIAHWLKAPYRIDGWRIDAANMVGRQGTVQLGHEVLAELYRHVKGNKENEHNLPDTYLVGEFFYDGTNYCQGKEVDGITNYQGFNFLIRRWLTSYDAAAEHVPLVSDRVLLPTEALAEQLMAYLAAVPYQIALQHLNQLSSHDTVRFLSATNGDKELVKLAITLLMTFVGIPCIYQGDEIGMTGTLENEAHRQPIPWDDSTQWQDNSIYNHYVRLIDLRRKSTALREGGFQLLYARGDLLMYQRESAEERVVILGYRGQQPLVAISIPVWHAGLADGTTLMDVLSGESLVVTNGNIEMAELKPSESMILVQIWSR